MNILPIPVPTFSPDCNSDHSDIVQALLVSFFISSFHVFVNFYQLIIISVTQQLLFY